MVSPTASATGISAIPHTPMDDLCLAFVNSRFNDHRGTGLVHDRLPMPGWWTWLLDRWQLGLCPQPDADELAELGRLRSLIRGLLESGGLPSTPERAALDGFLRRAPLVWSLGRAGGAPALELVPTASGVAFVAAAVVVSAIGLLTEDGGAVRRCGNPSCSFLFRDLSRNGTRRWCDPICGNLVKVRAFRAGHLTGNR